MATLGAFFGKVRASVRINQFVDPDCVADLLPGSLRDGIEFGRTLEALALEYVRRPFDLLWEGQLPEVAVRKCKGLLLSQVSRFCERFF